MFKIVAGDIEADLKEMEIQRAKNLAWTIDTLTRSENFDVAIKCGAPVMFNTLSLPAWLKVAEIAGITFIPARQILEAPIDDFTAEPVGNSHPFEQHELQMLESLQEGEMLRMEQVAPGEIKYLRSTGREMGDGSFYSEHFGRNIINLHEDRFYTTLMDLSEPFVRGYARPIIPVRKIEGEYKGDTGVWPEEFRVYVTDGKVTGVSNYYPQVSMDPEIHGDPMREAVTMARKMVETMATYDICNTNARFQHVEGEGTSCTLDFIVHENGEVMFIEGGPEGLTGAHPCCFMGPNHEIKGEGPLSGAVFSEIGKRITLEELMSNEPEYPELSGI
jgi:hypothetical protein